MHLVEPDSPWKALHQPGVRHRSRLHVSKCGTTIVHGHGITHPPVKFQQKSIATGWCCASGCLFQTTIALVAKQLLPRPGRAPTDEDIPRYVFGHEHSLAARGKHTLRDECWPEVNGRDRVQKQRARQHCQLKQNCVPDEEWPLFPPDIQVALKLPRYEAEPLLEFGS